MFKIDSMGGVRSHGTFFAETAPRLALEGVEAVAILGVGDLRGISVKRIFGSLKMGGPCFRAGHSLRTFQCV